jgi:hypothetical protein
MGHQEQYRRHLERMNLVYHLKVWNQGLPALGMSEKTVAVMRNHDNQTRNNQIDSISYDLAKQALLMSSILLLVTSEYPPSNSK